MSITVKNLGHTYHPGTPLETRSLQNISFDFPRGTWLSVAGHTGSGKSTLAQHLNGIILPMEGTVTVDGMALKENDLREIRTEGGWSSSTRAQLLPRRLRKLPLPAELGHAGR